MQKWLRRIRGAIGMGLTWGAAWFAVGFVPRWVFGIATDVPIPLVFGLLGLVAGATFSGVLALTEGRRTFDRTFEQMSLPRFGAWGAVGGLLLSGIFVVGAALRGGSVWGEFLLFGPALAAASAACAAGSLAVARWAERRELPGPSGDPAESELLGRGDR
jgi:hypothetical protein